MDQAKWSLPRLRRHVLTKSMQKLDRPRIKVQGCWAHGVLLAFQVIEVRQGSDGSMVVESLAKLLEHVKVKCNEKGKKFPSKVVLWVIWLQG